MREYIAESGGRYTYSDDIVNLQDLALSMTQIFDGCSNFIISGCEVDEKKILPGFVWINGKVRYFDGATDAKLPYYLYESNGFDTVTYANDENKRGRGNYLCRGGNNLPTVEDEVTGKMPGYIEIKNDYAPRMIDKFIGHYALLLDSPFPKQTVKKDLIFTGSVSGDKEISSKTAVSVVNSKNGYQFKHIVEPDGSASSGLYLNGLLINEVILGTEGDIHFIKKGIEVARISENGLLTSFVQTERMQGGSIVVYGENIINLFNPTDSGSVCINRYGYNYEGRYFRDFFVYDGKQISNPIFSILGKSRDVLVDGFLTVRNDGNGGLTLMDSTYVGSDKKYRQRITWKGKDNNTVSVIGLIGEDDSHFTVRNYVGGIELVASSIDFKGEMKLNGTPFNNIYVKQTDFNTQLKQKVSVVTGKGLSTEDFTTALKKKLDGIQTGNPEDGGNGYVTADTLAEVMNKRLLKANNLSDLPDKTKARTNLGVYSKSEGDRYYLRISNGLTELVTLSDDESKNLSEAEIKALKDKKQTAVRDVIYAERKGTGELKLSKDSNLSDVQNKATARKNIDVYSKKEIDDFLKDKLSVNGEYKGEVFTTALKNKLNGIQTGNFAVGSTSQKEGYVLVSSVVTELKKKAEFLLTGYTTAQKTTLANNIGVYSKSEADGKFATLSGQFSDIISYITKTGKSTAEAQKILRDKLNAPSQDDVSNTYIRKDKLLGDLTVSSETSKKTICTRIGAAYASDYQPKLVDSGWKKMSNYSTGTDTNRLYIRRIGNIVSIQGVINTAKRNGSNWGGVVASIPNDIPTPMYSVRTSACNFNDDHKYNRGASFIIGGSSRLVRIYESGLNNVDVEINFTYMT